MNIIKTNKGEDKYLLALERYGNMWFHSTEFSSEEDVIEAAKKWPSDDVSKPIGILKVSREMIKLFKGQEREFTWGGYSMAVLNLDEITVI